MSDTNLEHMSSQGASEQVSAPDGISVDQLEGYLSSTGVKRSTAPWDSPTLSERKRASHARRVKSDTPLSLDWMDGAVCIDAGKNVDFFPDEKDKEGIEVARKICDLCVVRDTCLDYAIDNRIVNGVWGGASEKDRKQILRRIRGI